MSRTHGDRVFVAGWVLAAGLLAGGSPAPLAAQETRAGVGEEALTRFARAHLAIGKARDAYHGQVGRIHERQARLEARRRLEATIAGILEEEGLTRQEYDDLTLLVSVDAEARATFERILAELTDPSGSSA